MTPRAEPRCVEQIVEADIRAARPAWKHITHIRTFAAVSGRANYYAVDQHLHGRDRRPAGRDVVDGPSGILFSTWHSPVIGARVDNDARSSREPPCARNCYGSGASIGTQI